jgi:hypothetical protein
MSTKIQTDPRRCWVRIDIPVSGVRWTCTLIGAAWAREPFGEPGLADEFSLTVGIRRPVTGASVGMRLTREEGIALRDALNQWLDTSSVTPR